MRALFQTTRLVCRRPTEFFSTPPIEGGLWPPIAYGASIYTLGQLIFTLQIVAGFLVLAGASYVAAENNELVAVMGVLAAAMVLAVPMVLVQSPAYGIIGILTGGALTHATLSLMKVRRGSFEETIRVVAYANAPYWYYWIPCLGPFIAMVWVWVAEVKGIRAVHQVSTDKAAIAVLGYRVLLIGTIVGLYAVIIGLAVVAAQQPTPY